MWVTPDKEAIEKVCMFATDEEIKYFESLISTFPFTEVHAALMGKKCNKILDRIKKKKEPECSKELSPSVEERKAWIIKQLQGE